MKKLSNSFASLQCIVLIIAFVVSTGAFGSGFSNKWRIQVSEGANSDGTISFLILPKTSDDIKVDVHISKGTSENHVAKLIKNAMKETLPKTRFHVERDDGEDVLVKKKNRAARFGLKLLSNSVKSVRISLNKE
jgi:hypothetical protein